MKWIGDAWAVSASLDGTVKIWDLSEARIGATWTAWLRRVRDRREPGPPSGRVGREGRGAGGVESHLGHRAGGAVRRPPAPPVTPGAAGGGVLCDVAVSPGGRWAIAVAEDGSFKLHDLRGDTPLRSFAAHQASDERDVRDVRHARVSEDGSRGVTVSCDGTVTVWDLATGRNAVQVRCRGRSNQVGVSADTLRAVGPGLGGALQIWDLTSGQVVKEVPEAGFAAYYLMLSGDGRRAVTLFWGPVNNTVLGGVGPHLRREAAELLGRECAAGHQPGRPPGGDLDTLVQRLGPRRRLGSRPGREGAHRPGSLEDGDELDGAKMASADGDLVVTDARTGQRVARAAPAGACSRAVRSRPTGAHPRRRRSGGAIHIVDEWPAGW